MKNNKKLYRVPVYVKNGRGVLGLCAGIANYYEVDANYVRLLFILPLLFIPSFILIYLIISFFVPVKEQEIVPIKKKMYQDLSNKKILGVSSSIANYFGVNANIIRILFILFLLSSTILAIFYYFSLARLIPVDDGII